MTHSADCAAGCLTRRHALALGAGAALAVPLLAACGSDSGGGAGGASGASTPSVTPTPVTEGTSTGPLGAEIGDAADVPVGGYAVYTDAQVVVTQVTAGEYLGFSAVCTHEGCLVSPTNVDGDPIVCKCHFSEFDLRTGAVLKGPATSPLPAVAIAVQDGKIHQV